MRSLLTKFLPPLTEMLNDKNFSDVALVCKDGIKVHASKMSLAALSPVFESMFTNGMQETKLPEISLWEVASQELLSVLEFLYTGTLTLHKFQTWTEAFKVLNAAQFFLLDPLKDLVWKFLVQETELILEIGDPLKAARCLSTCLEFPLLLEISHKTLAKLVLCLITSPMDPRVLISLSYAAFSYYLRTLNCLANENPNKFSLEEYLKFRNIILWISCQVSLEEASEVSTLYLPDAKLAVELLRNPDECNSYFSPIDVYVYLTSPSFNEKARLFLGNLIALVNFERIHLHLLMMVVKPLQICLPSWDFPSVTQRVQLLHQRQLSGKSFCNWQYVSWVKGTNLTKKQSNSLGGGSTLSVLRTSVYNTFAKGTSPIWQSGVYEWDIIYSNFKCLNNFCIGIMRFESMEKGRFLPRPKRIKSFCMRKDTYSWIVCGFRKMYFSKGGENGKLKPYRNRQVFMRDTSVQIRIHVNMDERIVKFSIDGSDCGEVWTQIPNGVYFPVVSFSTEGNSRGSKGDVRIELGSGFDVPI